ncbi:sigma 54-interacting transcriptional regulator [Pseudogracilibacillus sp. SE30717A]|uniref:sigma-54 interaction domain-containing protein n=1 Tax=Pseudogracilibacillus sp. SE30717A TaxID=3098293 RepID=UPI00300E50D3
MEKHFFENKHFHHVFNHLNDGIFIADKNGLALWCNDMSTVQIGAPRSEIIGRNVTDLENNKFFTPSVTKLVLEKREVVTKVQTSKNRQFLATGCLVKIKEDNTEYILVQVKDITETVRSSLKLEQAETLLNKYWEELQEIRNSKKIERQKSLVIGKSKKHEEMLSLIDRIASVDANILLHGETGVGKSLIAEELHKKSNRSDKPFVQVNCGAIPEALLESELFGYKQGAFTGASASGKIGLAEKADGGTLFLDEIGELPLSLQPKILQLVQNKSFIPIGTTVLKTVDIRIITATNRDLPEMVKDRKFREDLYYRLNVVSVKIPSLRERKEDILPLANHYFEIFKDKYNKNASYTKEVVHYLQQYNWPGNVRELENMIERLIVTAKTETIDIHDITDQILHEPEEMGYTLNGRSLTEYLDSIEKQLIEKAKKEHGSTRKAAQSLGLTQSSYVRRLKKYDL